MWKIECASHQEVPISISDKVWEYFSEGLIDDYTLDDVELFNLYVFNLYDYDGDFFGWAYNNLIGGGRQIDEILICKFDGTFVDLESELYEEVFNLIYYPE